MATAPAPCARTYSGHSVCNQWNHTGPQNRGKLKDLDGVYVVHGAGSVKTRVMTPQSSVNFPKTQLKRASNSGKHYKKRVLRAVFPLHANEEDHAAENHEGQPGARQRSAR